MDIDPSAIERARQEAPWATFIEASADRLPFPDHTIDVVLASVIFSSLPTEALERAVAREIERALRQGGWLVWYDLRRDNPWNPAVHGIDATRLASLFPGWQAQLRRTTLLPPLARRLGVTTALLYPLLERLPVLRSHLIGRLRSPVA